MTQAKKLVRILIDEVEGGFQITIETEDGQIFRTEATEAQIDDLADDIDEILSEDDSATESEQDTVEKQPS